MYLMNQLRLTDQILNAQHGIDAIDVEQNTYALKLVQMCGDAIKYLAHPSKVVCIEAVKNEGLAIRYLKHPDREICIYALKQNGFALQYIDQQDEALCVIAIDSLNSHQNSRHT